MPAGDRGGVARAGADLQQPVAGLERGGLEHQADDVGLGDGLALGDRQGAVVVGELAQRPGHEGLARDLAQGVEHARIAHAARGDLLVDHVVASDVGVAHGTAASAMATTRRGEAPFRRRCTSMRLIASPSPAPRLLAGAAATPGPRRPHRSEAPAAMAAGVRARARLLRAELFRSRPRAGVAGLPLRLDDLRRPRRHRHPPADLAAMRRGVAVLAAAPARVAGHARRRAGHLGRRPGAPSVTGPRLRQRGDRRPPRRLADHLLPHEAGLGRGEVRQTWSAGPARSARSACRAHTEFPHLHYRCSQGRVCASILSLMARPTGLARPAARSLWAAAVRAKPAYRSPTVINAGFAGAPVEPGSIDAGRIDAADPPVTPWSPMPAPSGSSRAMSRR